MARVAAEILGARQADDLMASADRLENHGGRGVAARAAEKPA
jgi:hypothetical protein